MRLTNWLYLVSVALFISGIGFIIAGARTAQLATPVEARAEAAPVATVKQLMDGIIGPSATVVFDSVGTIVDATGIHEKQPTTETEWAAVGASAAAIVESANLLVVGDRAVDKGEWTKMSKALADSGMLVLKATQEKNPMGILEAGETLNASCDNCHRQYQRE